MRLTAASNRALKVYGLLPGNELKRLAHVRRLRRGKVDEWPVELRESMTRLFSAYRQFPELQPLVKRRTARLTEAHESMSEFGWTPQQQAADLEAQAVIWAIEFHARGLIYPHEFGIWTRAWREIGLPL